MTVTFILGKPAHVDFAEVLTVTYCQNSDSGRGADGAWLLAGLELERVTHAPPKAPDDEFVMSREALETVLGALSVLTSAFVAAIALAAADRGPVDAELTLRSIRGTFEQLRMKD